MMEKRWIVKKKKTLDCLCNHLGAKEDVEVYESFLHELIDILH